MQHRYGHVQDELGRDACLAQRLFVNNSVVANRVDLVDLDKRRRKASMGGGEENSKA